MTVTTDTTTEETREEILEERAQRAEAKLEDALVACEAIAAGLERLDEGLTRLEATMEGQA